MNLCVQFNNLINAMESMELRRNGRAHLERDGEEGCH